MKETSYHHRLIARITIEAKSPLAVGTGNKSFLTDAPVTTDVNGLPYIPGTALTGILRHALHINKETDSVFGFQNGEKGHGSEIVFTDAVMIGKDGTPIDGLVSADLLQDSFYQHYLEMPIRQHVKINERGTAQDGAKFDNQVVFKGTRFLFEIELCYDGDEKKKELFEDALRQLRNESLRIGSGTRNGYGELEVTSCKKRELDLTRPADLEDYLQMSSKLTGKRPAMEDFEERADIKDWDKYELDLTPDNFFLFGSGMGDAEADMTPVTEAIVKWDKPDGPYFTDLKILIPASSVKGALAHRTAYHYNKLKGLFAGDPDAKAGDENPAVKAIFGTSNGKIRRGHLLISDVFEEIKDSPKYYKIVNHVSIDRFTGGSIDGALFTEKVNYRNDHSFTLNILVEKDEEITDEYREAFELALKDICHRMLPLGGGVNRGNGIFKGAVKRNGIELWKQ